MATHKVPQDVEAEDKLLGPLSLKQLIFTIVGLGFGYLVYFFFAKIHPLSALIWLPFAMFFLVLGLYQRKDQPAEVFLASAIQFYFKSRKRIWDQDGYEERVVITAPPKIEKQYTKNFTGEQAQSHLGNLSTLMDSRGWTTKLASDWQNPHLAAAATNSDRLVQPADITNSFQQTMYHQFEDANDVQDPSSSAVARGIETQLSISDTVHKQQAVEHALNASQSSPPESPPTLKPQTIQAVPQPPTPAHPAQPLQQREFTANDGSVSISLR